MKLRTTTGLLIITTLLYFGQPDTTMAHWVQSHLEMTAMAQQALYQDQAGHPGNISITAFLNQDSGDGKTYFEYLLDGCRDADMRANGIYAIDQHCKDYDASDTVSDENTYVNPDYGYTFDFKPLGECPPDPNDLPGENSNIGFYDMPGWPVGDHGYHPLTGQGLFNSQVEDKMTLVRDSGPPQGLLDQLAGATEAEKLVTLESILETSNARSMAETFYSRARTAWTERRYIDAIYNLGIVIHLVQDMSAPPHVHCGEAIANPAFHDEFERLVWLNALLPLNGTLPTGIAPVYLSSEIGEIVYSTAALAYQLPNDLPVDQIALDDLRNSMEIGINATTAVIAAFFSRPRPASAFMGLGYLPDCSSSSFASSVSDDGTAVAGACESADGSSEAFHWTQSTGMIGLGDLPGGIDNSSATAISGDGNVVVGYSTSGSGSEAFRWEQGSGMVGLGYLPADYALSIATAVSTDGSMVVGYSSSTPSIEAFRWTPSTAMIGLGDLPGGWFESNATGVSGDGVVVIGRGRTDAGMEAFRWTAGDGMTGLGDLAPGVFFFNAMDISSDGSAIVGIATMATGARAFLWTSWEGMVDLGDVPGGSYNSYATGTSDDADIVIGGCDTDAGHESFIWDRQYGMQRVDTALTGNYGIDLDGWHDLSAGGVSADGSTIVGVGYNPDGSQEAWVASIGAAVPGDLDMDADTDGADIHRLIDAWANRIYPDADIDGDGIIDAADIAAFAGAFGGNSVP